MNTWYMNTHIMSYEVQVLSTYLVCYDVRAAWVCSFEAISRPFRHLLLSA